MSDCVNEVCQMRRAQLCRERDELRLNLARSVEREGDLSQKLDRALDGILATSARPTVVRVVQLGEEEIQ